MTDPPGGDEGNHQSSVDVLSSPNSGKLPMSRPEEQLQLPAVDEPDSDDDIPIAMPSSSMRAKRKARAVVTDDEDGDDDDNDDDVIRSSVKRRRLRPKKAVSPTISGSESETPRPPRKLTQRGVLTPRSTAGGPSSSAATGSSSRYPRKRPQSLKAKKMEMWRRRRMGEKIDEEDIESSSEEGEHKALYDTDDEHVALSEFEDDEEGLAPISPMQRSKDKKNPAKTSTAATSKSNAGDGDEDLDDFIDNDDDLIGIPIDALRGQIPLEFTGLAHMKLKDHFRNAVEWLVHRRINPAFERDSDIYKLAWNKLDDEYRGLAQSKFISSGWKPDFLRALRARPFIDSYELDRHDPDRGQTCSACGRSNHPSTYRIRFDGSPYHQNSLDDVESDNEGDEDSNEEGSTDSSSDGASDDSDGHKSRDAGGNVIAPTSKDWFVGVVCESNASTAHSLMHWKYALKEWVEEQLQRMGYFTAEKLARRDKMKPKKRRQEADAVVQEWEETGAMRSLWSDFKSNLDEARNKSTTGRRGR